MMMNIDAVFMKATGSSHCELLKLQQKALRASEHK